MHHYMGRCRLISKAHFADEQTEVDEVQGGSAMQRWDFHNTLSCFESEFVLSCRSVAVGQRETNLLLSVVYFFSETYFKNRAESPLQESSTRCFLVAAPKN